MILGQYTKAFASHAGATEASNATASARFDCQDLGGVVIYAVHAAATATNDSAKWAVLDVRCGNDTNFSNATQVSGLIGTTNSTAVSGSTNNTDEFVLPAYNDTSKPAVIELVIPRLGGRGRYVFIKYQPPATTNFRIVSFLACGINAGQLPNSSTEANVAAIASAV